MNEHERKAAGRRYDRDFKDNAVGLVLGGKSISQVSRDLGVSAWSLTHWVQAARGGHAQHESKALAAESEQEREMRRLRQENDSLREQRDILKKASGHLVSGEPGARYPLMEAMKNEHSLPALAQALEVSPSGFYAHRQKHRGQRRQEDRQLAQAIAPVFATSRETYGCPRVTVARLPTPALPDQIWVADITYIDTGEGWLYLSGILDACTRRLEGWQAGETLAAELVTQAWQKAVRDRRPGPGLLHHSDRGVQYASGPWRPCWRHREPPRR